MSYKHFSEPQNTLIEFVEAILDSHPQALQYVSGEFVRNTKRELTIIKRQVGPWYTTLGIVLNPWIIKKSARPPKGEVDRMPYVKLGDYMFLLPVYYANPSQYK